MPSSFPHLCARCCWGSSATRPSPFDSAPSPDLVHAAVQCSSLAPAPCEQEHPRPTRRQELARTGRGPELPSPHRPSTLPGHHSSLQPVGEERLQPCRDPARQIRQLAQTSEDGKLRCHSPWFVHRPKRTPGEAPRASRLSSCYFGRHGCLSRPPQAR